MSPYQAIALAAGIFVAVVSAQVALARRGRPIGAVLLAIVTALAMGGLSFATLRVLVGSVDLPDEILRGMLVANAIFWGVPLLVTAVAALWLARRNPPPRTVIHWGITAAAGLLMYPVAMQGRERYGFDMVNAVDDGTGPRVVVHPTPEERLALARTLPECAIRPLSPRPAKAWHWQELRRLHARLPLSNEMREVADEEPDSAEFPQWEHERWGSLILMLDSEAPYSPGFSVGGGPASVGEPACGLRVGSSVVPIKRTAAAIQHRGAGTADSAFGASTDIPLALPDTQIGVGIVAHSRAGRDTLLSILAAMRFPEREKKRRSSLGIARSEQGSRGQSNR